jgi:hypothetical protein
MLYKMRFQCCCAAMVMIVGFVTAQDEIPSVKFSKRCLIVDMNEGCAVADVNKDGKPDIIAGEHWYAAPDFIPRQVRQIASVSDLPQYLNGELLQNTGDHPYDVDGDGWVDVISVGWTDKQICWYQNPRGLFDEHSWIRHVLGAIPGENEAIALYDFNGDGQPEIYVSCWNKNKPLIILRLIKDTSSQPALQQVVIGPNGGHGYAFGDINGDGREDILCESGWYERPHGDIFIQPWKFHAETALPHPSCPFVVAKLTDSGRNDIIWGKAHDYGIFWWEQGEPKPDGTTTWTEHLIDKSWSQPHGMVWADIDGDSQPELITGKRVRAHGLDGDPGSKEPECLYYYKWEKVARKFTRHTIFGPGEGVGMGTQICVADLNSDGRSDIVVAGKTGTWILLNEGQEKVFH